MSKKEPKKDSPPNESPLRKSNKIVAKFSPASEDILDQIFEEEDEPIVHFDTQIKNKKW
jgi:hypothetical protein